MKRLIVLVFCLMAKVVLAQDGPNMDERSRQEMMKRIEAARIAMITERLELTPEQAEKFWPVYREFAEERRVLRENLRGLKEQADAGASEEESKALVEKAYTIKQKELALEKTYSERMMGIISARQLMSLRQAEDDFRRVLLERLERRRDDHIRRREMQDLREEFQKDKQGN